MTKKLEFGAKSVVGDAASNLLEVLGDAEYPIELIFTNHMPRDIALPEVGLFLEHVCNPDEKNKAAVSVASVDQLQRTASSIEQISMLNGYEFVAITVEFIQPEDDGGDKKPEDDGDKNKVPPKKHHKAGA